MLSIVRLLAVFMTLMVIDYVDAGAMGMSMGMSMGGSMGMGGGGTNICTLCSDQSDKDILAAQAFFTGNGNKDPAEILELYSAQYLHWSIDEILAAKSSQCIAACPEPDEIMDACADSTLSTPMQKAKRYTNIALFTFMNCA